MYDNNRLSRARPVLESTLRRWPTTTQRLRLAADASAPRKARDFLGAVCADWDAPGFVEVGGLVLSELVSNAVLHAGGFIDVSLHTADGLLSIEVRDEGDGVPAVVPPARRTVGGNGLDIVSRLTRTWGVTPNPGGGKTVWCLVAPESGR